jgi:hypothetical protein
MPKLSTIVSIAAGTLGVWIGLTISYAAMEFGLSVARWLIGCLSTTSGLLLLLAFMYVMWKRFYSRKN